MTRIKDRTKAPQAPKETDSSQLGAGEQIPLLDVGPENLAEIIPAAKEYKRVVTERVALTAQEVALKKRLQEFAHKSGVKPLEDGSIRFKVMGVTVEVIPQDEKVKVKIDKDDDGQDEE